ncbi:O-antigen ligase family protein [Polymorphobacter sp.]|uniref:O-antigen ligase family protein n=1 Tax=Polymorphobacter sp. TaxID=1909290 RepID=UPI003F725A71
MLVLFIMAALVTSTWLALQNPRAALLLGLFLVSWTGINVELGLRLTAYQLVMAPLCLVSLLRLRYAGQPPRTLHVGWPFAIMVLYAIVDSAFQMASVPQVAIDNSILRSPSVRAVVQMLMYLFSLSPVILVPWLFNRPGDALLLFRVWLASTIVLAAGGFAQLIIWYATGTNPMPIGFFNALLGGGEQMIRQGIVNFDGLFIYRMNSFADEPRNVGTAVGLGMVVIQGIALATRDVRGRQLFGVWLLLLIAMILTYSTSGTFALVPAMWVCRVPVQRSARSITLVAVAVVLPLIIAVIFAEGAGFPVIDVISERTVDRFNLEMALEDFDMAIAKWLAVDSDRLWFGVGIGNAHLYATPYLLPEQAAYAEGQVFSAKTLVLRLISEQGLVGLLLFVIFILSRTLRAAWVRALSSLALVLPLSLVLLVMVMASTQLMNEMWFLVGTLIMLAGCADRSTLPREQGRPATGQQPVPA